MEFKARYDFSILINESENLVIDELERSLSEAALSGTPEREICVCEDCILDMAALALNILKPHYRVSLLGTMYAQAKPDSAYTEEIHRAVAGAIEKVSRNPAHD